LQPKREFKPGQRGSELLAWKHSECVGCEFASTCSHKVGNLTICFEEDGMFDSDTTDALLKRTIRFICKARKFERKLVHEGNIIKKKTSLWLVGSKPLEAVMDCSDMKEFVECQKYG
jgi:hypothetical protein